MRVYAFHKPRGVVCSTVSEGGARPVFELLAPPYASWFAVGRIDKESEGLLLLADDPRLAQRLMDPDGLPKLYAVVVEGFPREEDLAPMREGGTVLDGRVLKPAGVTRLGKAPRGGTRIEVVLREGANRQIRRQLAAAGFSVRRLRREAVGPVALGGLPAGEGRELSAAEVAALRAALGERRPCEDRGRSPE